MKAKTKLSAAVTAGLSKPGSRGVYQDYRDESDPEEGLTSCSPLNDDVLIPGNLPGELAGKYDNLSGPSALIVGVCPPPVSSASPQQMVNVRLKAGF